MTSVPNYSDRPATSNLNRTSFDANGQFTGTPWNKTAYIKNDANEGTVFELNKDMTLHLNSRYKNGGEAIFSNLDRKHTGISFDLLDKFIEAAKDGILEDVDHQGYTDENKKAFGKAFDDLRKQKLAAAQRNPYGKEYTNMKNGTEFNFTAAELETLYKAAGFDIKKAEEKKEEKVVVPPAPVKVEEKKEEEITGGDGTAVTQTNEVLEKFLGKEAAAKYIDFKYTGVEKQTVNGTEAYIVSFSNGEETITVSKNRAEIEKLIKENPEFKKDLFDGALPLGKKDTVEQTKTETKAEEPKKDAVAKPKKNAYYSKALFGGAFLNKADKAAHDQGKLDYMIDRAAYYQAQGDEAKADKIMKKAVKYSENHNVLPSVSKK